MARRKSAGTNLQDEAADEALAGYRQRLTAPAVLPSLEWVPVRIGPTWQTTDDGHWLLPERTLGWQVLRWCARWLQHSPGSPWIFTDEQARFILWWYAVDDDGRFLFRDGVLQRLKGWGKDPVGACLCAVEMVGPCRFVGWDESGQPIATDSPEAWIQTAAVSLEQTKNTMRLLPTLFTAEARARFRLQIGKELVHGLGDSRLIQAVTSSPATLEGARATFVLLNETQHWVSANAGHDMADVIDRNATKSPDGAARTLRITNAYEPGEDSVAQRDREAWEAMQTGRSVGTGLLYDSIEAPAHAPLTAEAAPSVVEAIRGDSIWLDTARIVQAILDPRNAPSTSRRFWFNQITATEDAWVTPQEWDSCKDVVAIAKGSTITLGFDGSKSDDHCALIGALIDRDHLFEIGVWFPDENTGEIDRAEVDHAVRKAHRDFDVVGFYSDLHPWESYVDRWAEDFGEDYMVRATVRQPIAWDLRGRGAQATAAVERLHDAIVESATEAVEAAKDGRRPSSARLTQCGSERFRQHVHNARRAPNQWGVTVRKDHRESAHKIDSVPAAALARLARMEYMAVPDSRKRRRRKRGGSVW